jgi:hypothetical protein
MSKLLYEIHITCYTSQAKQAAFAAAELHWKTSEIMRDPVLGNDTYYYLTKYAATLDQAIEFLSAACHTLQFKYNVIIVREKIEHIVYDIRHRPK